MAAALTKGREQDGGARLFSVTAWDGLELAVHAWGGPEDSGVVPLLCLPGLVRTGGDFARLAGRFASQRRVFAVDYAGHGRSGRSPDVRRYAAEACVEDVLDIACALHLERVVAIGTSFGGLLAMGLAAARPHFLAGVVLNDVGPEIGRAGAAAIQSFLAETPEIDDLDVAVRYLRNRLPHLGIDGDEGWQELARLTYAPDASGRWQPLWDAKIARLLDGEIPDLWPLFGALAHLPVLLVRGALSQILLPETVARMREVHTGLEVIEVPGVGHAPTLVEPVVSVALDGFLAAIN